MSEVTVIGLGNMGSALARALLKNGCAVTAWNRSPEKAALLVDMGAVSIGYRANVWNSGAEGQLLVGAIAGGGLALAFHESSSPLLLHAMLVAGALGGMAWAAIPALLRTRFNANEILVSLMLVYIAGHLLSWLVHGPWRDPEGFNFPQSKLFHDAALLPALILATREGDWRSWWILFLALDFPVSLGVLPVAWLVPGADQGPLHDLSNFWWTLAYHGAVGTWWWYVVGCTAARKVAAALQRGMDDRFIFAINGEELGLFGALLVIALFALLMVRGFRIAQGSPDKLTQLLAAGITFYIGIQALINMSVLLGLLPFAGNALPFFSYGGSNLTSTLAATGILLNISRRKPLEAGPTDYAATVGIGWRYRRRRVSRLSHRHRPARAR